MAERRAYSVFLIPLAYKEAADVVMALVNGDDPAQSTSFSVGANASGLWSDPPEWFYGGMPTTEAWESQVSNLATSMVQPQGGWPVNGVSEADAIAAAEQMKLQITVTQDGSEPDPEVTLAAALTALSLKKRVFE